MGFSRQEYQQEYRPFSKSELPQRACSRQNDGYKDFHVLMLRTSEDIAFMQYVHKSHLQYADVIKNLEIRRFYWII